MPHCGIGHSDGEQAHDQWPEHEARQEDSTEHREAHPEHRACHMLGVVALAGVDEANEGGDQDRREQARGLQLEEDVLDQVRGLVRVAEECRSQGGADGEHAHESRDARRDIAGGYRRCRPEEAGVQVGGLLLADLRGAQGDGGGSGSRRCAPGPTP